VDHCKEERDIRKAGSYAIAIDYWTSIAQDHYLAISYHYATQLLEVRSRLLDLVPVRGAATALLTKDLVLARVDTHFVNARTMFLRNV
jgi:hypothetical protein